jgi:predicted PurR-regulated permease PerM
MDMKKVIFCLAIFLMVTFFEGAVFAVDQAERISDREIIERLTRLEENQKAILQRIEDLEKRFEARFESVDKRFEDINRRFEDLGRQLDRMAAIFTALVIAVIGFAYWDRRTIIRKAKEETLAEIRKEDRAKELMNALLELAKTDDRLAKVLKQFNIL